MKIGIFETEHFEGAYPVIRLFDNGKNEITIFSYDKPYLQFKHLFKEEMKNYNWVVKENNASKYSFIIRIYQHVRKNNIELLYLNTVSNNYIFYTWLIKALPRVRIVLTLHDINGYFERIQVKGIRSLSRSIGKKMIIKAVTEFNVVSSTMVEYLKSKLRAHQKVHCVPGAVFQAQNFETPPIANPLHVVVPGTLDIRRRNYDFVFELLELLKKESLPVKITLLGGYSEQYGLEILHKCHEYSKTADNLEYYDLGLVDQPEFDRVMNSAHLVFIPSVIETVISDGVKEKYGESISSGNIFDIIKHARPYIIPSALEIDHFLRPSGFRYDTINELINFLRQNIENPGKYNDLLQTAISASGNYTVEKVRERNAELFFK